MSETTIPSTTARETKLRVAIEQFADSGWTGGMVYMQNLLKALRLVGQTGRPYTILTRREGESPYSAEVDQLLEISADPRPGKIGRLLNRMLREVGISRRSKYSMSASMMENRVDALFTHVIYDGPIGIPLIGWVPDFQYLHLPEMYKTDELKSVRKYHEDLIAQSKVLLVSSNDVRKDLAAFSPDAARGAHVVPFVAQMPADIYDSDPVQVCAKYHLPQRFFYLPNQFWKHKNHAVVLKALKILADRSVDICVVCTGSTVDSRNPSYFASLLMQVATEGVHDRFRILGLVPRADVFHLQRQALAILQPSLFEGWSTSIEEAKSLGKRVVASKLAVHLEQNPVGDFFDPHDPQALADCLERVATSASPGPDLQLEAKARDEFPARVEHFAQQFMTVVREATGI